MGVKKKFFKFLYKNNLCKCIYTNRERNEDFQEYMHFLNRAKVLKRENEILTFGKKGA